MPIQKDVNIVFLINGGKPRAKGTKHLSVYS